MKNFWNVWKISQLAQPLFVWGVVMLGCALLGLTGVMVLYLIELYLVNSGIFESMVTVFVVWAILLNLSFFYVLSLRPKPLSVHVLLLSLLNTVLLVFAGWVHLPLLLSLWTLGLLLVFSGVSHQGWVPKGLPENQTYFYWLHVSFGAALVSLGVISDIAAGEGLLTLAVLVGLSVGIGLRSRRQTETRVWLMGGVILLGVFVHWAWWVWLPEARLVALLPWYALQDALLAWGVFRLMKGDSGGQHVAHPTSDFPISLAPAAFFFTLLATLAWFGHGFSFFSAPNTIHLFGMLDNIAALVAGLLLMNFWWRESRIKNQSLLIYGLAVMVALLGVYLRLLWFGLAPLTVWDTAVLMGGSYLLFILYHFKPIPALYRLTLLMPMLAVLTIPLQLNSVAASSTLLAAATLYLLMQRRSEHYLPMYLGLLALNISLYLWIPGWANNYKLVQLYTIPIAITVLLMLQLHHQELKPSVLNAIRLAALSALYVGATLDVFMRPELSIFVLALGLSLAGLLLGIALRVRAFLYTGTLFLIFNVFGQLIEFYPENRLSKAIVLMVLGSLIAGGMIWFNIQREALMQRIRIMRADLARWE